MALCLLLHPELRLSSAKFALLCEANPDAVPDPSASGQLIQMTPTGGDTNECNTLLLFALAVMAFPVSATNPIQRAELPGLCVITRWS